jgi:hypothetical protein
MEPSDSRFRARRQPLYFGHKQELAYRAAPVVVVARESVQGDGHHAKPADSKMTLLSNGSMYGT